MIQKTIAAIGANVVQIDPSDAVKAGVSSGSRGSVTLTPADAEAILRECSAVRRAAPSVDCHTQIVFDNRNWLPMNILGTTPDFLTVRNWANLAKGRPFTNGDVQRNAQVRLVGQTIARMLFHGRSPIGKLIRIMNAVFLCLFGGVVGILIGHGISLMVAMFLRWRIMPFLPAIAAAFIVSASTGIAFGLYPAWRASCMDPIEALRHV